MQLHLPDQGECRLEDAALCDRVGAVLVDKARDLDDVVVAGPPIAPRLGTFSISGASTAPSLPSSDPVWGARGVVRGARTF